MKAIQHSKMPISKKNFISRDGHATECLEKPPAARERAQLKQNLARLTGGNTQLTQAETKLVNEQALFQTLLETALDYIYFKDRESRFVRASRSKVDGTLQTVRQTYRAERPETVPDQWPAHLASVEAFAQWLIGKTDFDTYPEAHARDAYEDEQEIIRTGQPLMGKL